MLPAHRVLHPSPHPPRHAVTLEGLTVIGLLGGVASGKSLVARQLADLGAVVLDADSAGHRALLRDDVRKQLWDRYGQGVFRQDGNVDRAAVARIVFATDEAGRGTEAARRELSWLESVTHPWIEEDLRQQAIAARVQGVQVLVLDAAVMQKAGWDRYCDHLVFIDVPRSMRLDRSRKRGWSEAQFLAREAAQESIEEKRRRCQFTIDNSASVADTLVQVRRLWTSWFPDTSAGRSGAPASHQ